uniref:BREX system Lon protease-like protein BrxL n=1 Tax=Halomonas sp. TaxID=1486246 RepID=UPI003569F41B
HTVAYMLKHSDLFDELPDKFYDSAFLDRLHFYIPGWEVDIIRGEMFSDGYGFVVDYLAEILRSMRNYDYSDQYREHFTLSSDISTRDRDGINKTFSGLMKILFPQGGATKADIEELLRFAIEGRKRVKDQLMRIDTTYGVVRFAYLDVDGKESLVTTLEEEEYPGYYHKTVAETDIESGAAESTSAEEPADRSHNAPEIAEPALEEKHLTFQENQKGISFDTLFGPYMKGASRITVTDPYIRLFYQIRNLMEFLEAIVKNKAQEDEVAVHLVTVRDEFKGELQDESFEKIQKSARTVGLEFSWEFDDTGTVHARHIVTDHGWKVSLDRGLDIFQHYEMNEAFAFANRLQKFRATKAFEVTFIKQA